MKILGNKFRAVAAERKSRRALRNNAFVAMEDVGHMINDAQSDSPTSVHKAKER